MGKLRCVLGLLSGLWGIGAGAEPTITPPANPPWEEFKALYRAQLERELVPPVAPAWHSLESAHYDLTLTPTAAQVQVQLQGRVLPGPRVPIPLFSAETAVAEVALLQGGLLLVVGDKLSFLPEATAEQYQVRLVLRPSLQTTAQVRSLQLALPPAVRNSAQLSLDAGLTLLEAPGLPDSAGQYHFGAQQPLRVVFRAAAAGVEAPNIEVQTRLSVQAERLHLQVRLQPLQALYEAVNLQIPVGASWVGGNVQQTQVTPTAEGLRLTFPPNSTEAIELQLSLLPTAPNQYQTTLPRIGGNRGPEGRLRWQDPEDSQWQLTPGSWRWLPNPSPGGRQIQVEPDTVLQLHVTPYTPLATPPLVLNQLQWLTSFAEGGQALSVLRLEVPPEAGSRLLLPSLPETRIWALKVNGVRKEVYLQEKHWIIPLATGKVSQVELAYVRQGAKLGLQGRLEAQLPALNLPAREVQVGIALPERVQLEALEGDFSPLAQPLTALPAEFMGRGYFFSSTFYQGDAMPLAIAYREPVQASMGNKP